MPKTSAKLPESLRPYFWDVDFDSLDPDNLSFFIIKRILDKGNTNSLIWLLSKYSKEQIKDTVIRTRDISRKTAQFWTDMLGLNYLQVTCLQKPYNPIPFAPFS